jgi:hypothetical protein
VTVLAAAFDIGRVVRATVAKRDAVVGFPVGVDHAAVNATRIAPKDDEGASVPNRRAHVLALAVTAAWVIEAVAPANLMLIAPVAGALGAAIVSRIGEDDSLAAPST